LKNKLTAGGHRATEGWLPVLAMDSFDGWLVGG